MISYAKTVGIIVNVIVASIALALVISSIVRLKVHLGETYVTTSVAQVLYRFNIRRLGLDYRRMGVRFGFGSTDFSVVPSSGSNNNFINDFRCSLSFDELVLKSMACDWTILFPAIFRARNCSGYVFVDPKQGNF